MDLDGVKERLAAAVDERADVLLEASHAIHANPELNFEETFAHDTLTAILEREGIATERSALGVDTAFIGRAGSSGPTIAVFCEYDALPGLGHACGHNVIASAGLGAGLATAALADELGGRVVIVGSPAEEGGGGKVFLIDKGLLDGVDAALMVHPAGRELDAMAAIAIHQVHVRYQGKAAHAAAAPQEGRNALDAAVLGYMNVAALRQHIRSDERIHGIFTRAGDKPNIVPAETEAAWYVRSPTVEGLEALKPRVIACLQAGADAAGCTAEFEWQYPPYFNMVDNRTLIDRYAANMSRLGRTVETSGGDAVVVGSTDMGNVSHLVPSIHPIIKVSPSEVPIHSVEFERWAVSADADQAVVDGAKAMAFTIADLWCDEAVLAAARAEFDASDRHAP